MMANNEKSEKFEAFKAGLLKWKNEHREEYNEFARSMTNCDEIHYCHIFKAVICQMPHIAKEWELSWGDDSDETFDSMFMLVTKENLPQQIADMFAVSAFNEETGGSEFWNKAMHLIGKKPKTKVRLSAPLLLSWLFYGKSFESMVAMIEQQMSNPSVSRSDKLKCSLAAKSIIAASIKNGYRTRKDWKQYLAMEESVKNNNTGEWALQDVVKNMPDETDEKSEIGTENVFHTTAGRKKSKENPLIDYLPTDSCEAVIHCIREFIKAHTSAMQQALPYFVLKDMRLRLPLNNGVEYAIALTKQFHDVKELRSEHSIRQAVGKLAGADTQMLVKDGKPQICRYIESDEYQKILGLLKEELSKALSEGFETNPNIPVS